MSDQGHVVRSCVEDRVRVKSDGGRGRGRGEGGRFGGRVAKVTANQWELSETTDAFFSLYSLITNIKILFISIHFLN